MKFQKISLLLISMSLLVLCACESPEAVSLKTPETGEVADLEGANLEIAFYKKYSSKTGKRRGKSDTFTISEKSSVRAFADFTGLETDRDYTAHLVWIKPDGKELFRRFAEFRLNGEEGAYTGSILWKDAMKLHKIRTEEIEGTEPTVTLSSRFNISTDRERIPGLYRFRVYLDRRLVREELVTVEPAAG